MSHTALERLRGLRIAHLIETSGPGGAERVVAHLARAFQALGAHNTVVLPAEGSEWLPSQLSGSGVEIERIGLRGKPRDAVRDLTRLFRRRSFDVAHSHEFAMAVYGGWAARRTAVRHVITMHGRRYYAERFRRRVALRLACTWSGRLVAVSEQLQKHLCRDLWLQASRVDKIWNGVPCVPAASPALRKELSLREGDRLLLAVGNLYPVKGHVHLVEALALLSERRSEVHLAIAGRGEMRETLAACARDLGVADRLHLLGLRADIPSLLASADIFVHPSLAEGLPLAILEAMHAGCPIVATDVGEIPHVLTAGETGFLVESADSRALATAIDQLLKDPARAEAIARRAAQRAVRDFDLSVMMQRYATLYGELLAKPKGSQPASHRAAARIFARS